jgi:hypothetical protein
MAGSSAAAVALLPVLENNYAQAEVVPETDPAIRRKWPRLHPASRKLPGQSRRKEPIPPYW